MVKKAAVIHDLSGFGKCSLTAALPVLAAMGVQACPLPTALLSNQTGFDSFYCDDYTEKMGFYIDQWKKLGVSFNAVYTGYIANEHQVDIIKSFLNDFAVHDTLVLVDPVMADDGGIYASYNNEMCRKMKELASLASVITPNLSELCILCGANYSELIRFASTDVYFDKIAALATSLLTSVTRTVVVTGVRHMGAMHSLVFEAGAVHVVKNKLFSGSFSGTGDLFSSVLCGALLRGSTPYEAVKTAANFIEKSIAATPPGSDPRFGIDFEKSLKLLL